MNTQYIKIYYTLFLAYLLLSLYETFFINTQLFYNPISLEKAATPLSNSITFVGFILLIVSIVLILKFNILRRQKLLLLLPVYHIIAFVVSIILGVFLATWNISKGVPKKEVIITPEFQIFGTVLTLIALVIFLITIYYGYFRKRFYQ